MKNFLENKCKDLSPLETIENIKNFFKEKNLTIIDEKLSKSEESGTWGCYVRVISNGITIVQTAGKGASAEFALASGYAEAFERFNNKLVINNNPFIMNFVLKQNYNKNGYYIDKNEKISNFLFFKNKNSLLYKNFLKIFDNEENLENFLNLFYNNQIIEVPYKNCFNEKDIIYEDPRLWKKFYSSSGMAAGNTLEEALVQGISEIFEHYVQEQYLKNPPKELHEISINLMNTSNQNIINNIEKLGKKIKIFDLSYNYKVPVCMSVLYNTISYNYIINFSSAPTIQIAIERALTELYQNINSYIQPKQFSQEPSRAFSWEHQIRKLYMMSTTSNIFFEPELAQIKKINKINNNFFLYENKEYTNKDFLFFYKNICKNNNIKLYYYINSKANNLYAIHIISPNFNYRIFSCNLYKEISNERKKECLELAKEQFVVIYNILINNDNTNLNNLNKINSLNEKEKNFLNYIFGTNWFVPFNRINCAEGIYNLCKEEINSKTILQEFKNSPFEFLARKYLTLYQYKKSNQYSDEEIYQIFYPLDNSLIKEDIEFCNDKEFIIKKIIIELIYTMYNSEVFVNMIKAYCD